MRTQFCLRTKQRKKGLALQWVAGGEPWRDSKPVRRWFSQEKFANDQETQRSLNLSIFSGMVQ
jgi:hypothetical protein